MASFRAVRRAFCTAAEATPPPAPAPAPTGRWERLKNSKAGVWCRSLLSDYKEACKEIVVGARDRPLKASVYMGLLGGAYACFTTKPDQPSFQAALLDRSNQLALLSPWIRNADSDLHVQNLVKLRNHGCLRHLSLGLFSLVYSADYDPDSALYEATCSNLSVPWRELPERVLDVGFAGRWWILDKKMVDFDVNEAEYKHLPAHMQATVPPTVQEVERNERLHKESWLPLKVPEEEARANEDTQVKRGDAQGVDTNLDTHVVETNDTADSQVTETIDMVDSQSAETMDKVDSQATETSDINGDSQVVETVDPTVVSQVKETIDILDTQVKVTIDIDSQVNKMIDVVDSQVNEAKDVVDSQVNETIDIVDSQVNETIDTVDNQVNETIDTVDNQVNNTIDVVDSQVNETIDTLDSQVNETIDVVDSTVNETNEVMDSQVKETDDIVNSQVNGTIEIMESEVNETIDMADNQILDTIHLNVDGHVTETVETNEETLSGVIKEEAPHMDSQSAEAVEMPKDSLVVEVQEDGVGIEEGEEPARQSASQN